MFKNDKRNKYSMEEIENIVNSIYNIPKNKTLTLHELGSIFKMTYERVRQLENEVLEVVRRYISKNPAYKYYYDSWIIKSKKKSKA